MSKRALSSSSSGNRDVKHICIEPLPGLFEALMQDTSLFFGVFNCRDIMQIVSNMVFPPNCAKMHGGLFYGKTYRLDTEWIRKILQEKGGHDIRANWCNPLLSVSPMADAVVFAVAGNELLAVYSLCDGRVLWTLPPNVTWDHKLFLLNAETCIAVHRDSTDQCFLYEKNASCTQIYNAATTPIGGILTHGAHAWTISQQHHIVVEGRLKRRLQVIDLYSGIICAHRKVKVLHAAVVRNVSCDVKNRYIVVQYNEMFICHMNSIYVYTYDTLELIASLQVESDFPVKTAIDENGVLALCYGTIKTPNRRKHERHYSITVALVETTKLNGPNSGFVAIHQETVIREKQVLDYSLSITHDGNVALIIKQ